MKKSKSAMLKDLTKQMEIERKHALRWEEQGQYGTIHHDRIKVYERQKAELEKSGRKKSKPEEVNDGS